MTNAKRLNQAAIEKWQENHSSTEQALRTWYPKDHPLHYDLHHPLGKLVGEWGELLDDYMKHLYKPDYEWSPLPELIDIWYYSRILPYQIGIELKVAPVLNIEDQESKTDYLIARAIQNTNGQFIGLLNGKITPELEYNNLPYALNYNYSILLHLSSRFNLTTDQLAEASWEKLKPGSERGEQWMKARET